MCMSRSTPPISTATCRLPLASESKRPEARRFRQSRGHILRFASLPPTVMATARSRFDTYAQGDPWTAGLQSDLIQYNPHLRHHTQFAPKRILSHMHGRSSAKTTQHSPCTQTNIHHFPLLMFFLGTVHSLLFSDPNCQTGMFAIYTMRDFYPLDWT